MQGEGCACACACAYVQNPHANSESALPGLGPPPIRIRGCAARLEECDGSSLEYRVGAYAGEVGAQ